MRQSLLVAWAIAVLLLTGCPGSSHTNTGNYAVTASGTLKAQGITSYMYGTHVLCAADGNTLYALRSETLNLDLYLGQTVTVKGDLVAGYPVDGGPPYLDVQAVE